MATFIIIEEDTKGRATLNFDLEPIVVGEKYNHADQIKFTIDKNNTFRGEPMDSFVYSVEIDGVKSQNTAVKEIIYPVDGTVPPASVTSYGGDINDEINVSDYIPYSNGYDRIIITNIEGKGTWSIDSQPLEIGQVWFYYEIANKLKFYSNSPGAEDDYAILTYKKATKDIIFPSDNTFTVDLTSLAQIESDLFLEPITDGALTGFNFYFELNNQIVNKSFQIRFTVDIDNFIGTPGDVLTFDFGINHQEYNTNGIFSIDKPNPNPDGIMRFDCSILMNGAYVPGDFIKIELLAIDNISALVNPDPLKNTLTFNL